MFWEWSIENSENRWETVYCLVLKERFLVRIRIVINWNCFVVTLLNSLINYETLETVCVIPILEKERKGNNYFIGLVFYCKINNPISKPYKILIPLVQKKEVRRHSFQALRSNHAKAPLHCIRFLCRPRLL